MNTSSRRPSRRSIAVTAAIALVVGMLWPAAAAAHPDATGHQKGTEHDLGLGVRVNSPDNLAGFIPAVLWSGTPLPDGETSDLAYAGTGCTPAHYAAADVEGKIAIVDDINGSLFPGDRCAYAFVQKVQSAQAAGAIGLIQVERNDEIFEGNAVTGDIPALAVAKSDGAPVRDAVIA
ncbi:MAG TPA: PA domain-containing protein, partial [Actinomycetota bacterium]|nr:PA domain-containing protein [Actinomycetota bacterium]